MGLERRPDKSHALVPAGLADDFSDLARLHTDALPTLGTVAGGTLATAVGPGGTATCTAVARERLEKGFRKDSRPAKMYERSAVQL